MLNEVEQLVLAGRSEEEIKAIYVARYGVRILADPPGRASGCMWFRLRCSAVSSSSQLCVCVRWLRVSLPRFLMRQQS